MWGGDGRLLLLLLLVVAAVVLCNSEDCTHYKNGIKGEDIILRPVFNGMLSEIIWKKEVNTTFKKVAEWDGALNRIYYYSPLVNRATINPASGILTIRNISQIDDGKYEADALVDGEYHSTYLCLKTLEPPPAPNLTCTIDDDDGGILVNCMSVAQYELPRSYRWDYINMKEIRNVNSTQEHSTVKLPKNTDLSKDITCIIVVSHSTVTNSINLMNCDSVGAAYQERHRIITVILIIVVLVPIAFGLIYYLFVLRKRRGISEGHPDEILPPCEADPELETMKTPSSTEGVSEGHPDEILPPCEADPELETMKTPSSTEEATTPES